MLFCIFLSGDGKHVLLGMENGAVQIHPLEIEGAKQDHLPDGSQADLSTFGPYWSLPVHDNSYGCVTGVKRSFDGRFVFTSGADGNLFAFELLSQEKIEEAKALAKAKIPSAKVSLVQGTCFHWSRVLRQSHWKLITIKM